MYNESNFSDKTAIQHLADEIAIQNILNAYTQCPAIFNTEEKIIILRALKNYLVMNSEMIIEKCEQGVDCNDGKKYERK